MAKKKEKKEEVVEPSFDSMVEGNQNGVDEERSTDSISTAIAAYTDTPDFDQDDVVIPLLRLAQGLTGEVQDGLAKPGQWLLTGYEPEDDVVIVPLAFAKRRELRDVDTRDILCMSKDGREGIGEPGGDCITCSLQEWTEGDDGKRNPPSCSFIYAYLVYVVSLDAMAMMNFKSSALRSGKLLNTIVAQRGMGKCAVRLTGNQRQGPHGNYYVPAVNPANVDADVLAKAQAKAKGDVVV